MKFDPYSWHEVQNNGENSAPKGRLRVQCSQPAPLYVEAEGYEALAGYGTAFTLDLSEPVTWRLEGPKGTRVYVHQVAATSTVAEGEVFTNIDRMPDESGQVMEVRRALRQFELERRQALREIRAERDALELARSVPGDKSEPAPSPGPGDKSEPAPSPGPGDKPEPAPSPGPDEAKA